MADFNDNADFYSPTDDAGYFDDLFPPLDPIQFTNATGDIDNIFAIWRLAVVDQPDPMTETSHGVPMDCGEYYDCTPAY